MFVSFEAEFSRTEKGLCRKFKGNVSPEPHIDAGIGKGVNYYKSVGRPAPAQAGYRIHEFFFNRNDNPDGFKYMTG
jgi:hypothetical protein